MKSNKKVGKSLNTNNLEDQEFENYLQKVEDPDYDGQDVS
jgi:hypothetical protein